ncbi:hypothetical protein LFM09_03255 [Lentzea alba]|uniref:hypothetical protein n=1 Tax=Lentzea alba TaxID=2714351 RepID=UPI0039BF111A
MKDLTVQNYDPNVATEVVEAWAKFGTKFRELAADFNKIMNDSQAGWSGAAAEGVRQALSKVGKFSDDTGHAFHATAQAIATQRDAAVQANRSMPEPVEFSPLKMAGEWALKGGPINPVASVTSAYDAYSTYNEKNEAKQYAVQVMQQRDTTMMAAAQSMPVMDATPEVTKDQGVTQTSSTTSTSSLNNVGQYRPPANTGMPSIPPPNTGNNTTPSWVAPQVKDPNLPGGYDPNKPGGNQNRPGFPPGGPGGFPPGRIPPGGGGQGRPPGGGPGMRPGGPGGGGAGGGRGMGAGGVGGMGAGRGMGSFGPSNPGGNAGVMGPGGAGAAGAGAGAGRAGAAGAGGMGAGAGAGAGKGGEEDKEHKSNYLVPTDEFFDDDRMVAPPVIGG